MYQIEKKLYIVDKSYLKEDFEKLIKDQPLWRQEIINKFKVQEAKKLSLLASILFSKAIKDIDNNININDIKINFTKNEKPYIENEEYKNIFFNISHSKDKAIIVISNEEVGCDIEKIKDFDINIAKRFFTKKEYELIDGIFDKEKQKKIFYKIWTMKESYLKQKGTGIVEGLDIIDFSNVDYDSILCEEYNIIENKSDKEIVFFHNIYDKEYMITICDKQKNNYYKIIRL